ncbi:MAG TPA: rod shape-determining protein MreD [Candidatus Binatia bacterium]|nr:rod shape-determining protein MreD [Candidatus Binatia bacterium]
MRLFLLFFFVGIFLILLQSTFLSLLPFGPVVPDLVLILCVYLGLHHPTMGAAVGSFVLGYSIDVVSSRQLGFNAFAMTLVFLAVYFSSRTIWLQNPVVTSLIVLFAALVKGVALVLVWVVFLKTEGFWLGAVRNMLMEAIFAAALAPVVFSLLRRSESYMKKFDAVM